MLLYAKSDFEKHLFYTEMTPSESVFNKDIWREDWQSGGMCRYDCGSVYYLQYCCNLILMGSGCNKV